MQLKKRHHYIWRNYLRSWSEFEQINTYFIDTKKIIKTNLINISQEKMFYKLEIFTDIEKEKIEFLLNDHCEKSVLSSAKELLKCFYLYSDFSKNKPIPNCIKEKKELEEFLNYVQSNTIEDILTEFENYGKRLISVKSPTELDFLQDKEQLSKSLLFLTIQYTRTKNIKDRLNHSLKDYDLIYNEKFWILLSFIYALNLTYYLGEKFKLKIIIYNNISEINFITSDQPAFNSNQENKNAKDEVTGFDLFYPINNRLAIKLVCNKDIDSFAIIDVDEKEVIEINTLIYDFAYKNIFFTSERDIENLI
ncbi:DUF4238 domain-containing protein [Epilithonimonas ginsengisoli]|uniref:DUF4238 domain-containing protein n=1 Tax=Epilithonimonas ginsengisoli TaxID=1245592 RepID=A0ABU4JI22_9FLAO|nr:MULTISPECIES: DUF4238 domain-containing protein [Chryseobacterium group]MBV6879882.1 DUF4238 domain-containing protein [Epilithonimonas sp. FP105]MDW8549327.1 DUF4238 domain-containing protein [Epilithonimonas ginsengisoli]OAH70215.1 hypothetical protein AXA65_13655 [Chryseobacterium sp. FP211-J200]